MGKMYSEAQVIDLISNFANHVDEEYRPYTKNNMIAWMSVNDFVNEHIKGIKKEIDLKTMSIDEKHKLILNAGFSLPFIEYYPHTHSDCYKMLNPFTKYAETKHVLCTIEEGYDSALNIAINSMAEWKKNKN